MSGSYTYHIWGNDYQIRSHAPEEERQHAARLELVAAEGRQHPIRHE